MTRYRRCAAEPEREPLALFGDARRALAEIEIGLSDGSTIHAIDVFTVEGDLIRSFPAAEPDPLPHTLSLSASVVSLLVMLNAPGI